MAKPDKKIKDALNQLLKATGSDKTIDEILSEKLPCGHTQEEHMFASFLTKQAADVGVSPKTLLGAAKTIIENEESLLQLQAEIDAKDALESNGLESSDLPAGMPMILAPMPKEVQQAMTISDMQAHITELAAQHNIDIKFGVDSIHAHAHVETRSICGMEVKSEKDYVILLHEMGHIVMPGAHPGLPKPLVFGYALMERDISKQDQLIAAEELAWQWARQQARLWTPAMEAVYDYGIGSYRKTRDSLLIEMDEPMAPVFRKLLAARWQEIKDVYYNEMLKRAA